MSHAGALERLNTQRAAILTILQAAEAMLNDPIARDITGLAMARWSLMRELTAYQMAKHAGVLDPVTAKGDPRTAARARQLKQEGVDAEDAFRSNVTHWSATDVGAVWPTYQASALAMIARLRNQMTRDEAELAALVSGMAAIPPRPAAPPRPGPPTPAG